MDPKNEKRLSYEDFFKTAIIKLRNPSKSRGIHSVFTGFNQAFRDYYGEDPVKVTQELAAEGKIETRPVKKGVMIYLPGEAPTSRSELGKKALETILSKPREYDPALLEEVIGQVCPTGKKKFPDDFLPNRLGETFELQVPGTSLHLDSHSKTTIVSPKRHFRHEAQHPAEAKYILNCHNVGQKKIKIPKDKQVVFNAVKSYEKYCRETKEQLFSHFLHHTNNEEIAQAYTNEAIKKLDLRAIAD